MTKEATGNQEPTQAGQNPIPTFSEKLRQGIQAGRDSLKKLHREVSRPGNFPDLRRSHTRRASRIIVIINESHPQPPETD